MENNGRFTFAELSDLFDFSSGTIFAIPTDHLEMRRAAARWIPRLLTKNDKTKKVQLRKTFLWRYSHDSDHRPDISAMLRKKIFHIYDTQSTEGYCDVILIKN